MRAQGRLPPPSGSEHTPRARIVGPTTSLDSGEPGSWEKGPIAGPRQETQHGSRGGARRMTGTWPTGTAASPKGLLAAKATGGDHEATLLSINA